MSKHYSTVVVGAGPAGIMAAMHAASKGSVLLVDAMKLPRDKSCGGMLNEYAQAFISDVLKTSVPASICSCPRAINFRFFDWDRDIRRGTSLRFLNVERAGFDEWLMGFLPDNVEVVGNTRMVYCSQKREGVTVQLRAADSHKADIVTVTCDYLVGADGPMTEVRKHLPVSQLSHYKTLQDYLPLQGSMEPYFDCVYARGIGKEYGYGYVIPKGDAVIVGSVFYPGSKNVKRLHEKALGLFSSYFPYSLQRTKREAWSAIQVRSAEDIVGGWGRVLLAGEAGGIFSPSSGEGISFALNSGAYAGTAIAMAQEGATVLGPREHFSIEESEALRLYRIALEPIRENIARRLRLYPIIDSDWGKWMGGNMPRLVVDRLAHII